MKIGYPAAGTSNDHREFLSKDFVQSGQIGICDLKTGFIEVISKEEINTELLSWLKANQVKAIITPEIAPMALNVFKEKNIPVFKSYGTMLKMNIELLKNGELKPMCHMGISGNGNCSPAGCSSCNSCQ